MLSVKKVLAGRGAVDYYLNQTRHGLADYYLSETDGRAVDGTARPLSAPGSSWWGGGAEALGLSGEVARREFVPLYAKGVRPGGGYLGRRFRQPEEAAAAKAAKLNAAAGIADPYERWMARHEIRRTGGHASVAGWDCTFSPVKSVSLLWAAGDRHVQREVWAAHTAAVDAGLAYLQEHAAYVRAGRNGVRVLETIGLVVARMNEWTSRDGDMQLHTHCLVLNRAQTVTDGKWRALDGRAVLSARTGAGAIYNRTLEAELTRRLGVAWRDRPDGLRELDGVDDELIEAFSNRRRAITAKVTGMVDAYRDKHGVEPPPAVVSAMAQHATLATRQCKRDISPAEALDDWEARARQQGRDLSRLPRRVLGRTRRGEQPGAAPVGDDVETLIGHLADARRATFTRHDLLRAALDVLPPGGRTTEQLQADAHALIDAALATPELLSVTAPEVLDPPPSLRRSDGTSIYEQPARQRWTLRSTLDQERWLLDVATEACGAPVAGGVLDAAVVAHELGDDQAQAVWQLLGCQQRIGLLVGPAGAGKTRTLRAVVDAWQQTGGEVVGLTVSQSAAEVLAAEAEVRAENTAKWLFETRAGRWQLPDGALVLVDEASMVATPQLVEIVEQARRAGGRVLLIGDPAQLAAIHIGGAFDLLAERHGAARLHEIRRFTERWERDASQTLRRRDPAALAAYAMRGRIHGGSCDGIEAELFDAWRTDTLATTGAGRPSTVLMIVGSNEQAAVLGERARHALIDAGVVQDGPIVSLRDNVASVGDVIVTRRNDRRLRTSTRGWVINGDTWSVLEVYRDGAADVRRHTDGATITLPADYLATHCHLGYATTAHRAQGMTVDVCHAAITPDASHEQLYVAATRGRHANHLWVVTDADRDVVRDPDDLPAPEEILSRVLQRRDVDRLSAHQAIEDSLSEVTSLARLGAVFEDAARAATDSWAADVLARYRMREVVNEQEWPAVVTRIRQAALAGHDAGALLDEAIRMRPIDDVHSAAAVLHWRLGQLIDTSGPVRPRGPLASLPPAQSPEVQIARQAGELIRARWRELRTALAETTQVLPWATELGARPAGGRESSVWLTAATAVTAYRERYEVPDYLEMLGPRPAGARPDAQAAWDHARHQADRHLAMPLRALDDRQLAELDTQQATIIHSRPAFDPAVLHDAWHTLERLTDPPSPTGGPDNHAEQDAHARIRSMEELERRHARWRRAASQARTTRRLIALEQHRRDSHRSRAPKVPTRR